MINEEQDAYECYCIGGDPGPQGRGSVFLPCGTGGHGRCPGAASSSVCVCPCHCPAHKPVEAAVPESPAPCAKCEHDDHGDDRCYATVSTDAGVSSRCECSTESPAPLLSDICPHGTLRAYCSACFPAPIELDPECSICRQTRVPPHEHGSPAPIEDGWRRVSASERLGHAMWQGGPHNGTIYIPLDIEQAIASRAAAEAEARIEWLEDRLDFVRDVRDTSQGQAVSWAERATAAESRITTLERDREHMETALRRVEFMDDRCETAVIQMGAPGKAYWWVLCPATSTLIMEPSETVEDEANCSQVCEWVEEHAWADAVIRESARRALTGSQEDGNG